MYSSIDHRYYTTYPVKYNIKIQQIWRRGYSFKVLTTVPASDFKMATGTTVQHLCSPFDTNIETVEEFVQRFEVQCSDLLHKVRNDDQRKARVLIQALPVQVVTDLQRRLKPILLTNVTYDELLNKLRAQYEVKKSLAGAAVQFFNRKQKSGESIEDYAQDINNLAAQCEYKDCCRDRLLKDVFISGLNCAPVLTAVLQSCEKKTFNECVEHAKLIQRVRKDASSMQSDFCSRTPVNVHKTADSKTVPADYVCIRCKTQGKHFAHKCFALNLLCKNCNKVGHIAKACRRPAQFGHAARMTSAPRNNLLDESEATEGLATCHASSDDHSPSFSPAHRLHGGTTHPSSNLSPCCSQHHNCPSFVQNDSFLG